MSRKRQNAADELTGSLLTPRGRVVRLVRRRRSPSHPWRWRGVCELCGPLGDGWTASEQAATELSFEHARRHVQPEQLVLELETPTRGRRRRRAA